MSQKKWVIGLMIVAAMAILSVIGLFIYLLTPQIYSGHIDHVGQLVERYYFYNIDIETKGDLFFIERRLYLANNIVVFGVFNDNIEIFQKETQLPFGTTTPNSFFLAGDCQQLRRNTAEVSYQKN